MDAERQRFDTLVMHTPHGTSRYKLPWTFSTFDYREICQLLWRDCDATFETAKVNGRAAGERRRLDRGRYRPRDDLRPAGGRRARLAADAGYW